MTKSPRFFFGVFLVLVLFGGVFFYRGEIFRALNGFRSTDYERLEELELENEGLKAELNTLRMRNVKSINSYLIGRIYSSYPFNNRRSIVVDIGAGDNVKNGMPVLAKEGVLLGQIKEVKNRVSIIQTIFDPQWRSSAVIEGETKALLEGGRTPLLTLISKDASVSSGSQVFNTSPEFPLGLFLGNTGEVKLSPDGIWLEAELSILYEPEGLGEVLVVTDFP